MSSCIVHRPPLAAEISQVIRQAPLAALRHLLSDQDILDACEGAGHHFRRRCFDPIVTVLHFVLQAIQREQSFAATWQNLFTAVATQLPELDLGEADRSALTHARGRLPVSVLQALAVQATARARTLPVASWKGFNLLALDTATVSMPDEPKLHKHFGTHQAGGMACRYPLATFASLLTVGSSVIRDWRFGPYDPGEIKTCLPLLANLNQGDLFLADLRFAGAAFLAKVHATGADFLLRKHHLLKVEKLPVLRRLGKDDFITELTLSKDARKKDPTLPEKLCVRMFKAGWTTEAGEKLSGWFVTSLQDSRRYKKRTLAKLYHRRWQVETSFLEYKQIFHADVLRSKTVQNIEKEFAAHVLGYQLVRRLILAAAEKHHVPPLQISLVDAARWVVSFSAVMSVASTRRLPELFQRLLDAIASTRVDVRPGRMEPRWISRERKHFPRRRIPRTEWRQRRLGEAA